MEKQTADERRQTDEWNGCEKLPWRCKYPHCTCVAMSDRRRMTADGPTPPPNGGTPPAEGNYTIHDFKDEVKQYLDEWLDGVDDLDAMLKKEHLEEEQLHVSRFHELHRYDPITRKAFINGAAAFAAFACKRAHIEPLTDNK